MEPVRSDTNGGYPKVKKSVKNIPEMKRSRGVHSRRAQEHYLIPSRREGIDFQKSVLKILKKITEI